MLFGGVDVLDKVGAPAGPAQFPMQGRGAVPHPEQINEIVWLVINFIKKHPGEWIVLHCTHGFNRTGGPHAGAPCSPPPPPPIPLTVFPPI